MYDFHFGWMVDNRPARVAGRLAMKVLLIGGFLLIAGISFAYAQSPPQGVGTINQAIMGVALTKSDSTVFPVTRGLYVGDAAACNIAIRFKQNTSALTFPVGPYATLPFSVTRLMSTNTTCVTVFALY